MLNIGTLQIKKALVGIGSLYDTVVLVISLTLGGVRSLSSGVFTDMAMFFGVGDSSFITHPAAGL